MLLKNASRGAVVCVASGIIIITLFSKIGLKKKTAIVLLLLLGIALMYQIGLFSALEERIMNDEDGTGSGRTLIWAYKLSLFFEQPTYKLFTGLGHRGGFMLGFDDGYGFHNDFIAFFVDYGIIGTILFISLLLYPLIIVRKNKEQRAIVTALTAYLILCCLTLEPLSAGRLAFYCIYLLIYILAKQRGIQNFVK
jgi:O-antigen ligase